MNIVDWAVQIMGDLGPFGVFLLILLENVFPPIPSEVVLPLAGVDAGRGGSSFVLMLLASVAGSVAGAWLLYGIGRALGPERLRRLVIRLPLIHVEDYDSSVQFMERHGSKAIFFGRMVPGVRSLISIPAGLYAMPIGMFTLLTALGSAIWNTLFVTLGFFLGDNWTAIEPWTNIISTVVYVLLGIAIIWFIVKLVLRDRRRRAQGLPDPDAEHMDELERRQE